MTAFETCNRTLVMANNQNQAFILLLASISFRVWLKYQINVFMVIKIIAFLHVISEVHSWTWGGGGQAIQNCTFIAVPVPIYTSPNECPNCSLSLDITLNLMIRAAISTPILCTVSPTT